MASCMASPTAASRGGFEEARGGPGSTIGVAPTGPTGLLSVRRGGAANQSGLAPSATRSYRPAVVNALLLEELKNRLLRPSGKRERIDAELLPGLQGHQVGAFLGDVREVQLAGAFFVQVDV